MDPTQTLTIVVGDPSGVGEARRVASALALESGADDVLAGRVALVVTEAATNLLKHAGGGEVCLRALGHGRPGVEVLALDRGAGMRNVAQALVDGHSTAGSAGTGMGAMARAATEFDVYSSAGGTALFATVNGQPFQEAARQGLNVVTGVVSVPYPGERVCGDCWDVQDGAAGPLVLVADGLGHGAQAREAADLAVEVFRRHVGLAPSAIVAEMHTALRSTRGAAVAVAQLDERREELRYCAVGNIAGRIVLGGSARGLLTHNGTLGHEARRFQELTYPWQPHALLVLHTDGIGTHWQPADYPDLWDRHPAVVAAILYRDHRRGRDDATVLGLGARTH
jgi:anti-sigma regulatory factor (Ser/Thr protein kinase)